jgi:hypothetical protein
MASKKSKKPRIPRARRAPKVTEMTLGESIIEQMQTFNATLALVVKLLAERNSMLSVVTSPVVMGEAAQRKAETPLPSDLIAGRGDVVLHSTQPVATAPKKRGRPSKAEIALRAAQVEGNPVKVEQAEAAITTPVEQARPFPKTCPCGVREDVPKHLHAKGCPVHFPAESRETTSEPTPPPPAAQATEAVPAPTLDDVRASAISFVGRHGKEKLAAMLASFGAEKLSSVATDKLPALLAAIQAAG